MDDWSLAPGCHAWILQNIPPGSTIVELGSGVGSARLSAAGYSMVCVEHSEEWLGRYPSIHYIHAPLKSHKPVQGYGNTLWYSPEILKKELPKLDYAAIIVDGPPGSEGRSGILKYFSLFNPNVPFILDDLHRQNERKIAGHIAAKLNTPLVIYPEAKYWGILWPNKKVFWK